MCVQNQTPVKRIRMKWTSVVLWFSTFLFVGASSTAGYERTQSNPRREPAEAFELSQDLDRMLYRYDTAGEGTYRHDPESKHLIKTLGKSIEETPFAPLFQCPSGRSREFAKNVRMTLPKWEKKSLEALTFLARTLKVLDHSEELPWKEDREGEKTGAPIPPAERSRGDILRKTEEMVRLARRGSLPVLVALYELAKEVAVLDTVLEKLSGLGPPGEYFRTWLEEEGSTGSSTYSWKRLSSSQVRRRKREASRGDLLAALWLISSNPDVGTAKYRLTMSDVRSYRKETNASVPMSPTVPFSVKIGEIKQNHKRRKVKAYVSRVRKALNRSPVSQDSLEFQVGSHVRSVIDFLLAILFGCK